MPHVVNGCGTWYYGKKNAQEYVGTCQSCNRIVTLESYDTRLFVVALYIPLIPLGRKRIVEKCPACTKHGIMPLKEWQTARDRTFAAIEQYQASRGNAELAEESLAACLKLRDLETFLSIALELESDFANSAEVLMFVAFGYDLFGRLEDGQRVLEAAMAVEDTNEIREMMGVCLLRQGRPEDAEAFFQHIVDQGLPDSIDCLYQLAQCWQAKGEHERAIAVFDQCEVVEPSVTEDKTFMALRAASEGKFGTHKPIRAERVIGGMKRAKALGRFARIAPAVLLLAIIAYFAVAWYQGANRTVFIVNGLQRPYDILLNGDSYTLPPGNVERVTMSDGQLSLELPEFADHIPPESLTIETPFWTRPFSDTLFVINPDRSGLVDRTRVYYGEGRVPEPKHTFFIGQTLHRFEGIDHPFEDFPDSIYSSSKSDRLQRDGLFLMTPDESLSPEGLYYVALETVGEKVILEMTKRRLLMEPEAEEFLVFLSALATPEESIALLRKRLGDRPPRMDWHRAYQDCMSKLGRDDEIEQMYREMLAADPDNAGLMYLLARSLQDTQEAFRLCEQASRTDQPSAYASYWLCGQYATIGRFDNAARDGVKAIEPSGGLQGSRFLYERTLIATEQYDRALELLAEDMQQPYPNCMQAYRDEAYVRFLVNPEDDSATRLARLREVLADRFNEEIAEYQTAIIRAQLAYVRGDIDSFVQALTASERADLRFAAALAGKDLATAQSALEEIEMPSPTSHLLVYMAASLEDDREVADRQLAVAIDLLAEGSRDDRTFADALADQPGVSVETIINTFANPAAKAVYLAAIATRSTDKREAYLDLAEKLNFDRRFPHRLIQQVIEHHRTP